MINDIARAVKHSNAFSRDTSGDMECHIGTQNIYAITYVNLYLCENI